MTVKLSIVVVEQSLSLGSFSRLSFFSCRMIRCTSSCLWGRQTFHIPFFLVFHNIYKSQYYSISQNLTLGTCALSCSSLVWICIIPLFSLSPPVLSFTVSAGKQQTDQQISDFMLRCKMWKRLSSNPCEIQQRRSDTDELERLVCSWNPARGGTLISRNVFQWLTVCARVGSAVCPILF